MRRSKFCSECGMRRSVHRLYVRRQVSIPLPSLDDLPIEQRALILRLREGRTNRRVQRFMGIGWWCEMCGWIMVEVKPKVNVK